MFRGKRKMLLAGRAVTAARAGGLADVAKQALAQMRSRQGLTDDAPEDGADGGVE